jgi:hypothetical protein
MFDAALNHTNAVLVDLLRQFLGEAHAQPERSAAAPH